MCEGATVKKCIYKVVQNKLIATSDSASKNNSFTTFDHIRDNGSFIIQFVNCNMLRQLVIINV